MGQLGAGAAIQGGYGCSQQGRLQGTSNQEHLSCDR